jgi:hypothetical protein
MHRRGPSLLVAFPERLIVASSNRQILDRVAIDGKIVARRWSSDPNSGFCPTWTHDAPRPKASEGFQRDIARRQSDPVTRAQRGTGGSDALRLRLAWMCSRAAVKGATSS